MCDSRCLEPGCNVCNAAYLGSISDRRSELIRTWALLSFQQRKTITDTWGRKFLSFINIQSISASVLDMSIHYQNGLLLEIHHMICSGSGTDIGRIQAKSSPATKRKRRGPRIMPMSEWNENKRNYLYGSDDNSQCSDIMPPLETGTPPYADSQPICISSSCTDASSVTMVDVERPESPELVRRTVQDALPPSLPLTTQVSKGVVRPTSVLFSFIFGDGDSDGE